MQSGGLTKIGKAEDPDKRRAQIQRLSATRVRLVSRYWVEKAVVHWVERRVHEILEDRRAHGEWFRSTMTEAHHAIRRAISESDGRLDDIDRRHERHLRLLAEFKIREQGGERDISSDNPLK